jgi:hypothetical protein
MPYYISLKASSSKIDAIFPSAIISYTFWLLVGFGGYIGYQISGANLHFVILWIRTINVRISNMKTRLLTFPSAMVGKLLSIGRSSFLSKLLYKQQYIV